MGNPFRLMAVQGPEQTFSESERALPAQRDEEGDPTNKQAGITCG